MNSAALEHRMDSEYAYRLEDGRLVFRLRCERDDLHGVRLHFRDQFAYVYGMNGSQPSEMQVAIRDSRHDYWEAVLPPQPDIPLICYYFEVDASASRQSRGAAVRYFGDYRVYDEAPVEGTDMFYFFPQTQPDTCVVPEWARRAVVYQVFPDRFSVGSRGPQPGVQTLPWGAHAGDTQLLGGTIRGIHEKLEYLETLGVTCLYLTPIFASDTAHKYNTFDYYRIDPQFGSFEEFRAMVEEAHRRDIRVIIDGVFNHCGVEFFAFKDLCRNQENSSYRDWFRVRSFPVSVSDQPSYETFGYLGYMPKLATENRETADYLINVATWWIREAGIDGWRLDCAPEVDHRFWRRFRDAVKAEKHDALLVGEFWHDARTWLSGDQMDSTLNYTIMLSLEEWMINGSASAHDIIDRFESQRALYRQQTLSVFWNLIGSHDTDRFLTKCNGNTAQMKIALALALFYPGAPVIYYGDEIGMEGADPYHRAGMRWDLAETDNDLLSYYKEAIALYRSEDAFAGSDVQFLRSFADENLLAFIRGADTDAPILVVLNPGPAPVSYDTLPVTGDAILESKDTLLESKPVDTVEAHTLSPCSAGVFRLIRAHTAEPSGVGG